MSQKQGMSSQTSPSSYEPTLDDMLQLMSSRTGTLIGDFAQTIQRHEHYTKNIQNIQLSRFPKIHNALQNIRNSTTTDTLIQSLNIYYCRNIPKHTANTFVDWVLTIMAQPEAEQQTFQQFLKKYDCSVCNSSQLKAVSRTNTVEDVTEEALNLINTSKTFNQNDEFDATKLINVFKEHEDYKSIKHSTDITEEVGLFLPHTLSVNGKTITVNGKTITASLLGAKCQKNKTTDEYYKHNVATFFEFIKQRTGFSKNRFQSFYYTQWRDYMMYNNCTLCNRGNNTHISQPISLRILSPIQTYQNNMTNGSTVNVTDKLIDILLIVQPDLDIQNYKSQWTNDALLARLEIEIRTLKHKDEVTKTNIQNVQKLHQALEHCFEMYKVMKEQK